MRFLPLANILNYKTISKLDTAEFRQFMKKQNFTFKYLHSLLQQIHQPHFAYTKIMLSCDSRACSINGPGGNSKYFLTDLLIKSNKG